MKLVPCSNPNCNQRRKHFTQPDEMRKTRQCEVPDDHTGPFFCSITCACEAGAFSVTKGWLTKKDK